jgi:SET domain-containing protein
VNQVILRFLWLTGRIGNFTRFINHSCRPNSQFERFVWMGLERIVVVSKGVKSGSEITSDYSRGKCHRLLFATSG